MIKKFLTGFQPKPSSKLNGEFPKHTLEVIKMLYKENPNLYLCGSAALILSELLPYRKMHDVDFVLNERDFENSDAWRRTSEYSKQEGDEYTSYEISQGYGRTRTSINVLVFADDIKLNTEDLSLPDNTIIKCQSLNDIISWKEKYNRTKDKQDLDAIASKALEEAVFTEEK
jgi:hypothetical protein